MFDFSRAETLIMEKFPAAFVESLRREIVFLNFIEPRKVQFNEKDIRWKVNYAGNPSVGSYAEGGSVGINQANLYQSFETASLQWKLNKVAVAVTGLAQQVSVGSSSIYNALTDETRLALIDLKRNINKQCLSDGVGNLNGADSTLNATGLDITGIQAMVDDGGDIVTYGNINRGVNTWWQSYVLRHPTSPGTTRPLTQQLMFQVLNTIQQERSGVISHILCSPNVHTAYGLLLEQARRRPTPAGQVANHSGGFRELDFNGVPVVLVPSYQENRMDFINVEDIEYLMLLDFQVEQRDPGDLDASKLFIRHYSQLKMANPWKQGSLRDLAA